jgi:hypothetical protein
MPKTASNCCPNRGIEAQKTPPTEQREEFLKLADKNYFFRRSRISVSSTISAGGAVGAASSSFFIIAISLLAGFTMTKNTTAARDEERNDGTDNEANVKGSHLQRDLWVSPDQRQQGFDNTFGKSRHNAAKGCANDDASGEIDDVAFKDEFFEFVEHGIWLVVAVMMTFS